MTTNIKVTNSNFCLGPQIGTYCTVDSSVDPVVMHVKNNIGTLIRTYSFNPLVLQKDSTANHNKFAAIKYVGPYDQSSFYNGAVFYTLERIEAGIRFFYTSNIGVTGELTTSSETEYNGNIIRRWVLDAVNFQLKLESSYYKNSDDLNWYDGKAFAIANIKTNLGDHVAIGTGTIELTTSSGIAKYDKLLIGPSSDVTNLGVVEEVYVHSVVGNNVTIKNYSGTIPTKYEYMSGDPITVFKDIMLFSNPKPLINELNIRYGFERPEGSLYSLSSYDYGNINFVDYNGMYNDVPTAAWNNNFNTLSFIKGQNLIHLNTSDYTITKSQVLMLTKPDKITYIPIYDLDLNGVDVYKLQKEQYLVNDSGVTSLEEWTTYNYVLDSLEPHTHSITVSAINTILFYQGFTYVEAIVRDQYGIGLLGVNVVFSISGDSDAFLTPSNGFTYTDNNGLCSLRYDSGAIFMGCVIVKAVASGSLPTYGSAYVTGQTILLILPYFSTEYYLYNNNKDVETTLFLRNEAYTFTNEINILCFARYSFPGGHWQWNNNDSVIENPTIDDRNKLPSTDNAENNKLLLVVYQPFFNQIEYLRIGSADFILNSNVSDYSNVKIVQVNSHSKDYISYIVSLEEANDYRYVSQNYLSRHILNGHIITSVINQYIFIQEARPAFWSEKNPTQLNYWIRLRPFAASLNHNTLKIEIFETSYLGISNTTNIAPLGTITLFDAGNGLQGIDFGYTFSSNFHHNSIVTVKVTVYDYATIPNILSIDYWFKIVADYRAPYIENYFPMIEAIDIPIDTNITFDVLDIGEGVDITTLEVYVNNQSTNFTYDEYENGQYHVFCNLVKPFYFTQQVSVLVIVKDRSVTKNTCIESWKFYCTSSSGPWFNTSSVSPGKCQRGISTNATNISTQVYGINQSGIDYDSLKLEVGGKYRNIKITPIVYRLK